MSRRFLMNYQKLIQNIDELAKKKGISRTKALVESGVGKNFVNNIERKDGSNPGSEKIQQLADYFNVSTDFLLGNDTKAVQDPATDDQLKFALFGTADIDDDILETVKRVAESLKETKLNKAKAGDNNDNA